MSVLDVAQAYTRAGWRVVPVRLRTKRPDAGEGWQDLRLELGDLPRYFAHESNVGVLLGQPSGWLIDVDLDTPEACSLAQVFLPSTVTFGRKGKPFSHWLYRSGGIATERYRDITPDAEGKPVTLLELRSTGGQTVFPGSVHPCGDTIEWSENVPDAAEPHELVAQVDPNALRDGARRLAVATLLARNGWTKTDAIAAARGNLAAITGPIGDHIRKWFDVTPHAPAPAPRKNGTNGAAPSQDLGEAVRRWNFEHAREYPRNSGKCPICGHDGCFGRLASEPTRWACFSAAHPADAGVEGDGCHHGDALDLEAATSGRSRVEVLRADGYLAQPNGRHASGSTAPATSGPPPGAPVIEPSHTAEDAARALWGRPLPPALPTGIEGLDRAIVGLRSESICVLNGPPGRGKSGMVIQIARHIAESGKEVVYLTSELSARQVLARVVAQIRRVPWLRIYELGPSEAEDVAQALAPLKLRVIEINRGPAIRDLLDRVADETGTTPVLILDYLQHAARRLDMEDQRLAVGRIADQLVTWARDTHSLGMVVSSVGRASYVAEDGAVAEDFLAAGKDAGEIEYDASAVLFLAAELAPEGGTAPARLHVSKHRFGASGQTIGLVFDAAVGTFRDDPQAALSDLERECYRAIANGAKTANDVFDQVGGNRKAVLRACRQLCRGELVEGPPLRVRGGSWR